MRIRVALEYTKKEALEIMPEGTVDKIKEKVGKEVSDDFYDALMKELKELRLHERIAKDLLRNMITDEFNFDRNAVKNLVKEVAREEFQKFVYYEESLPALTNAYKAEAKQAVKNTLEVEFRNAVLESFAEVLKQVKKDNVSEASKAYLENVLIAVQRKINSNV